MDHNELEKQEEEKKFKNKNRSRNEKNIPDAEQMSWLKIRTHKPC